MWELSHWKTINLVGYTEHTYICLIHIQIEKNTLYKVLEKKSNEYRDVGAIEEREKRSHLTRRWEGEDM